METPHLFGRRVRARRAALGLTQEELAQRVATILPRARWNRAAISRIEHGSHNPSQRTELALALALDTSMAWLWGAEAPTLLTSTQRALLATLATWSETAQLQLLRRLQDPHDVPCPVPRPLAPL